MKLGINKSLDLIRRLSFYVFFKNNVETVLCQSNLGLKIIKMSKHFTRRNLSPRGLSRSNYRNYTTVNFGNKVFE